MTVLCLFTILFLLKLVLIFTVLSILLFRIYLLISDFVIQFMSQTNR